MKICTKCKIKKELKDFYLSKQGKFGVRSTCKTCDSINNIMYKRNNKEKTRILSKQWAEKNPEKRKIARKKWATNNPNKAKAVLKKSRIKYCYNLSLEDLNKMIDSQKNCCKICNISFGVETLCIDHVCINNVIIVRGLLCKRCNTGIGLLKDKPDIIKKAAEYVEQFMLNDFSI